MDTFLTFFASRVTHDDRLALALLNAELPLTELDCHHDAVHAFLQKCSWKLPKVIQFQSTHVCHCCVFSTRVRTTSLP